MVSLRIKCCRPTLLRNDELRCKMQPDIGCIHQGGSEISRVRATESVADVGLTRLEKVVCHGLASQERLTKSCTLKKSLHLAGCHTLVFQVLAGSLKEVLIIFKRRLNSSDAVGEARRSSDREFRTRGFDRNPKPRLRPAAESGGTKSGFRDELSATPAESRCFCILPNETQ